MKSAMTFIFIFSLTQSCAIRPNKSSDRTMASVPMNFQSLNKNIDFYYIAEDLVHRFDSELDRIHKIKKYKKTLSAKDIERFEKQRSELRFAWEFSEKNLDQFADQYAVTLEIANNKDSVHQASAQTSLVELSKQLSANWYNGDKSAVGFMTQHLSDINLSYQKMDARFQTVDFKSYSTDSVPAEKTEYTEISKKIPRKIFALTNSAALAEWTAYKNERFKEIRDQNEREPQALDILEPAADGKGTVTGNRFPTGTWALTFDDGPHPTHTREMYAALKSNSVRATFFWLTKNILLYPDIVKEAPGQGHSRANHSYSHPQLPSLNPQELDREVTQAGTDFAKVVGQRPTLFRCPYGNCGGSNSVTRQLIAKNNMIHVGWNVDTLDWQDKNPTSIFERTKKQIDILGRGIILFHDIHPQSVEAVKLLIPYMKNVKKFQIKPLKEIISIVREKSFESP